MLCFSNVAEKRRLALQVLLDFILAVLLDSVRFLLMRNVIPEDFIHSSIQTQTFQVYPVFRIIISLRGPYPYIISYQGIIHTSKRYRIVSYYDAMVAGTIIPTMI